jgi:hypothetical protein
VPWQSFSNKSVGRRSLTLALAPPGPPLAPRGKATLRSHLFAVLALAFASLCGGCAASKWTVKPHQRELLADRIMQLDAEEQERSAEDHILSNREGAIGGSGTSGGGCGCN